MKSRRDALVELSAALLTTHPNGLSSDIAEKAEELLDVIDSGCGYENLCPDCNGDGSCQSAECATEGDFICDGACARCGGVGFVAWEAPPNGGPILSEENS